MTILLENVAFKHMPKRALSLLAAGLLAAAPARALEGSGIADPLAGGAEPAAGTAVPAGRADAPRLDIRGPAKMVSGPAILQAPGNIGPGGKANPYREHAPLALFSLGSLAMGGVFYGIHRSFDPPGGSSFSGDGTRVNVAIGAAGISALAAGAAYFWYAVRAERPDAPGWAETVAAGVTPDGGLAAKVTVPLSALID